MAKPSAKPTSSRLVGIKAKIERTNQHINDLEQAMRTFRNNKPYGFPTENDPKTGDEIYRIEIRQETPITFSLITGDALHNLRSALDHLAWQAHEADGGTPDDKTEFPIRETSAKYKPAELTKKQKFSPHLISLFQAVQPYQSGYELLWILHKLNNIDKHRLLLVTAFGISGIYPVWKTPDLFYQRIATTGLRSGIVRARALNVVGDRTQDYLIHSPVGAAADGTLGIAQNGTEVARRLAPLLPKEDAYLDLTLDVAFGEPPIVKGKPVVPLLTQLAQLVDSIVNQFVPLL